MSRLHERILAYPLFARIQAGEALPRRFHVLLGLVAPLLVLAVNMWRVHWFTVDDAYISFRYAVNLVDGHGLVYNPGERIEGYTNFLWTVVIAGGLGLGIDPHVTSKLLGATAAFATMVVAYRLTARLLPLRTAPAIVTWLLASSSTFSGYAVLGLETDAFAFFVLAGTLRMFQEEDDATHGFPWSGVIFALGGLTRPEAPLFIGIPMVFLGRRFFGRRNLVRGAVFVVPLLIHLLWRHEYYGSWIPATLSAKTGDFRQQWNGGRDYLLGWVDHAGPIVFLAIYGLAIGLVRRHRETLSIAAVVLAWVGYILLVGGDWMTYYRYLAPAEPFVFLLACFAIRAIVETRDRAAILALCLFGTWVAVERVHHLGQAQRKWIKEEKKFWDNAAGQSADWLARQTPGRIAIGDIGYVGYRTNFPILDLLGLVDPVIADLPGGYTRKLGEGYRERFFEVEPAYVVIILSGPNCNKAVMQGSRTLYNDLRFKRKYELAHNVHVVADASWCTFRRKDVH